ncbi:MAG: hypothetical protein AAGA77_09815 [Bacteroidota bacterium]
MNTPKKISPHFYYHEFFSQGIWQSNHEHLLKRLLDERIIVIMEHIRVSLDKPIYVNNWKWGGNSMYRGFRPRSHQSARYSQHKFGRAVDFHVKNMTPDEVRQYILDNEQEFLNMGLTRLEHGDDAPTWVHLDLAWTGLDSIYVFRAN